jgi:hypothetical protein
MDFSSRIARATVVDEGGHPILVGWPWRIVASRDFNRDNRTDIVWHNESTGETQIWFMNVGAIRRRATVDAWNDGGDAFVLEPWRIVRH